MQVVTMAQSQEIDTFSTVMQRGGEGVLMTFLRGRQTRTHHPLKAPQQPV